MKQLYILLCITGTCLFMSCQKWTPTPNPTIITVAGGNDSGSAANQLNTPWGIYVDKNLNLYVADYGNNRVQEFPHGSTSTTNGITIAGGNGPGSAANQLDEPTDVFMDDSGNLYVADYGNNRIQEFPPGSTSATNGITVAGGNGMGPAANQFNGPVSIVVDDSGNIYASDGGGNNRILEFPPGSTNATDGLILAGGNGAGSAANQFDQPFGIWVDNRGNIYVGDAGNGRIQEFPSGSTSATNGVTAAGGNGAGSAPNQLYGLGDLFVDNTGNIYVADYGNSRIQKFPPGSTSATNGSTVAGGNGLGPAANQLDYPIGIYVDHNGDIYVGDTYNNRIQEWAK